MTTSNPQHAPFETFLASEQARLVRFCSYLTGDSHAAEDLAQETLLIAWRQRSQMTDPNGITYWLTAIARNVCRHYLRGQRRRQLHLCSLEPSAEAEANEPAQPGADFDVEVELERSELITLLDRALGLLPAETRTLLIQHYVEEFPQAELAARSGLTTGAVAVRLHRGKLALRQALVTEFRADAVTYGLIAPDQPGWVETRLWCVVCGQHRLLGQFEHNKNKIALRCPGCNDPHNDQDRIHSSEGPFLRGVKTYKPAAARIMQWVYDYYLKNNSAGIVPCLNCGRPQPIRVGRPPSAMAGPPKVYVLCEHCDHCPGSNAWAGLALALPQVRRFWQAHPRMRTLPEREAEISGSPAVLTGFESVTGDAKIEVAFAKNTLGVVYLR
ncbi:MAG: RNA polymerase sigma factor [Caldilineaceae bacterium]